MMNAAPSPRRMAPLFMVLLLVQKSLVSSFHTRGGHKEHYESQRDNMNGDYVLSSTPGANNTQQLFPTNYRDYPDLPTESFDVYSPLVSQLYSQVYWKGLPPVKLPDHIVTKYDGRVMAVVGFELDQVMQNENGQEQSIPMNAVYNHHFESTMIGGSAARFELASPDDPRLQDMRSSMGHGIPPHQPYWLVVGGDDVSSTGQPARQDFGGANGGEVRQSFHGYAPGFAQLIESPKEFQITPMQIDTWHREKMDLKNSTHFVPGPLPRNSLAPPNATYSGLLECPVSTRIHKYLPPQGFFPLSQGRCSKDGVIANGDDCYKAVVAMVHETDSKSQIQQASGSDPNRPVGCSVHFLNVPVHDDDTQESVMEAYYNKFKDGSETTPDCGSSTTNLFGASATSLVHISVLIDTAKDVVTLTLTGPGDVWFGVGFGAQTMKDQPWTIVVDGNGNVVERKLAEHAEGTLVNPPTVQVKANRVHGDQRTVVLARSLRGQYFTFDSNTTKIPFINAVGSSEQFSYHQSKEASSMLVLPVAMPDNSRSSICVCQKEPPSFGAATGGSLEYYPVSNQPGERGLSGKVSMNNHCDAYPRMDLLEQKNPTCDIRTYVGGQNACHHMWSLLDADQEIPWVDQPLEYRLKFRFWVQPYDPSYHTNVHRTTWGIGSPVEYDVPKCKEGIAGCSRQIDPKTGQERWVHTIRGKFKAKNNGGKLVSAHFHCHAPTCLSTALYLCDYDEENEVCDETTGTLLCQEDAVWKHGEAGERFNEPGFIFQPPCLWGSPDVGLEPPVDVRGRTLYAIKTADATYGHHGEMAWLQMYFV